MQGLMARISKWFTDDTITPDAVEPDHMLDAYLAGEEVDQCKVVIKYEHGYGYGDTPEQAKDDAASLRDAMQELEDAIDRGNLLSQELTRINQTCEFLSEQARKSDLYKAELDKKQRDIEQLQKMNAARFDEIRKMRDEIQESKKLLDDTNYLRIKCLNENNFLKDKVKRIDPAGQVTVKGELKRLKLTQKQFDAFCKVNKVEPFKSSNHGMVITRRQSDAIKAQVYLWRNGGFPVDESLPVVDLSQHPVKPSSSGQMFELQGSGLLQKVVPVDGSRVMVSEAVDKLIGLYQVAGQEPSAG